MSKPSKTLTVTQNVDAPVPTEILAAAIVKISEGFSRLSAGGLNERALVVLLHDSTNVGKPAIRDVLRGLETLKDTYCTKRKK